MRKLLYLSLLVAIGGIASGIATANAEEGKDLRPLSMFMKNGEVEQPCYDRETELSTAVTDLHLHPELLFIPISVTTMNPPKMLL